MFRYLFVVAAMFLLLSSTAHADDFWSRSMSVTDGGDILPGSLNIEVASFEVVNDSGEPQSFDVTLENCIVYDIDTGECVDPGNPNVVRNMLTMTWWTPARERSVPGFSFGLSDLFVFGGRDPFIPAHSGVVITIWANIGLIRPPRVNSGDQISFNLVMPDGSVTEGPLWTLEADSP